MKHAMPHKQYFIAIFMLVAAIFSAFTLVVYQNYDEASKQNDWAFHHYEVARQSRLVMYNLLNMETGVRGYLLTGRTHFLEPYHAARKVLPEQLETLRDTIRDENNENLQLKEWMKKIDNFQMLLTNEVQKNVGNKGLAFLESQQILEKQKVQMDELRNTLESTIALRLRKVHERMDESRQKNNQFVYILVAGNVLAIGVMLVATLIIMSLIARNERTSRQVAESEDRLRLIMSGVHDGMYDYDCQSGTIYYSPEFKSMLGYAGDEFPDTLAAFNEALHPEDADGMWATFERYRTRETPAYANIFRMQHKDGSWRWILSRGVGFWDPNGTMTRMVGTHMDITEQKRREEALAQLNSELESFTFIASHDLRSPLVNLKGFARELTLAIERVTPIIAAKEASMSPEERKTLHEALREDIPEALNFIEKSVQRMDTLTTAVLDLSRIGKREYTLVPVDMNAILHKCIDAQAFEINQKKAQVICEKLPVVLSDPLALEQVFSNLLDNAVKYLSPARQGKIVISARESVTSTLFMVEDNGRGIEEADQKKVFEMFRRARNAEDVRGSGMGMSFVRATLRKIGGEIWYESALGKGSTFYVRLAKQKQKGKPA